MAKTITGTAGADEIIVTESNVTVNAGAGDDIISLVGGSRNVIHGDGGNDTIIVKSGAGTGNKLYGDAGNDIINLNFVSSIINININF